MRAGGLSRPDNAPRAPINCRSIPTIVRDIGTATAALHALRVRQRGTRAAMLHVINRTIDAQQDQLDRLYAEKRAAYAAAVHRPAGAPAAPFKRARLGDAEDRALSQMG